MRKARCNLSPIDDGAAPLATEQMRVWQLCPSSNGTTTSWLFTDDDTVPPLDWVAKLVRWFDNPEVGAVRASGDSKSKDQLCAR